MCDPNDMQLSLMLQQQQHVGGAPVPPNILHVQTSAQPAVVGGAAGGGPVSVGLLGIAGYAVPGVMSVPAGTVPMTPEDISRENFWLREKLKEITSDRDKLLCEVANLRFELDMAELKRLPEDR